MIELWDDKEFIEKRIKEQLEYKWNLEHTRILSEERKKDLDKAAKFQYDKFVQRLKELNILVAQSGERQTDILKGNGS